ncbi:hypothetical protein D932_03175 [Enterococcus casseliflavus 14-MB-W-14]|nr:hypothetical protein D932_03175 [Enterococcus casseliflavus 14-MB-W-14]
MESFFIQILSSRHKIGKELNKNVTKQVLANCQECDKFNFVHLHQNVTNNEVSKKTHYLLV